MKSIIESPIQAAPLNRHLYRKVAFAAAAPAAVHRLCSVLLQISL